MRHPTQFVNSHHSGKNAVVACEDQPSRSGLVQRGLWKDLHKQRVLSFTNDWLWVYRRASRSPNTSSIGLQMPALFMQKIFTKKREPKPPILFAVPELGLLGLAACQAKTCQCETEQCDGFWFRNRLTCCNLKCRCTTGEVKNVSVVIRDHDTVVGESCHR